MSLAPSVAPHTLADLKPGQSGLVERLELDEGDARRLMELGFLPGATVQLSRRTPFGDPSVYRIDDADIGLRRETAAKIHLRDQT